MKNTLVALGFCLVSLLSCAPTKYVVSVPPPEPQRPVKLVEWEISFPDGWKKDVEKDPTRAGEVKRVLSARKEFPSGATGVLAATLGRIGSSRSSEFAQSVLDSEGASEEARVLQAETIRLGDVSGIEFFELRIFDRDALAGLVSVAVAKDDTGFYVTCGASVEEAEEVIPECVNILSSVRLR